MSDLIKIYSDERCRPGKTGPAVVTVGTFDGVHLGHQEILKTVNSSPAGEMRTVITFEPHPQSVIRRNGQGVPLLTTTPEKARLLCRYGVDRIYIMLFDLDLANLSAEEFVQEILLSRLQTRRLVIGYNHSFGRGREGNIEFLRRNRERFGFELDVVGPYFFEGEAISSTRIRKALLAGDVERAAVYLGRPYSLSGVVVTGVSRGRQIGFPTANLEIDHPEKLVPPVAVYAVALEFAGETWPGALAISTRPTFGHNDRTVEVHVIGFSGDLYGRTLDLHFLKKLRNEVRYDSVEKLTEQMHRDVENSLKAYHSYQEQAGQSNKPVKK